MMTFSKNLYIGESIKNPSKIKWKLKTFRGQANIYLLSLANNSDQLDCFHNNMLKQKFFRKQPLLIVGIAGNYEEALLLILQITNQVYQETKSVRIKEYLFNRDFN